MIKPHAAYPCSVEETPPYDIILENIIEEILLPYKLRTQNYLNQLILYGMIVDQEDNKEYFNHEQIPAIPHSPKDR